VRKRGAMGTCLGGRGASPSSPGLVKVASGGLEMRDGAVAWIFGLLRRARPRKRERKGRCLGGFWGWCEFYGEVEATFYCPERPGVGPRGWPGRGLSMAMTRSSARSSGRDGRGSMGCICRCCGDVGGALASQGDERNDGKQWHLRTWSG
jgi:hypothetical protein